jgi:hypothetical protein
MKLFFSFFCSKQQVRAVKWLMANYNRRFVGRPPGRVLYYNNFSGAKLRVRPPNHIEFDGHPSIAHYY